MFIVVTRAGYIDYIHGTRTWHFTVSGKVCCWVCLAYIFSVYSTASLDVPPGSAVRRESTSYRTRSAPQLWWLRPSVCTVLLFVCFVRCPVVAVILKQLRFVAILLCYIVIISRLVGWKGGRRLMKLITTICNFTITQERVKLYFRSTDQCDILYNSSSRGQTRYNDGDNMLTNHNYTI